MQRLFPALLMFAALPAMAVTPRAQHTCIAMGHFAGQVQQARQAGLPATQVQHQAAASPGSRAEHLLWREIIDAVYEMPAQAASERVNRSFYANCMSQMRRKRR